MDGGQISINQRVVNGLPQEQINSLQVNKIINSENQGLEQIFQQDLDEDDQDLYEDDSGQLLKGIDPIQRVDSYETSPGLGNKKRNAKLQDNKFNMQKIKISPPQTDLKNMSDISITSSKKMKTPKMSKQIPIPNYALPTVETFIKDIRNKQLSQNSLILQNENDLKKTNPMIHYQKDNLSPSSIRNLKGTEKMKNKYYIESSKSKEGSSLKRPRKERIEQMQKTNIEIRNMEGVRTVNDEDQDINLTQDDIFAKYAVTSNSQKSQINIKTFKSNLNQQHQFLSSRQDGDINNRGNFKQSDKQTVIQTLGVQSELEADHSKNSMFINQQNIRTNQNIKRQKVKINSPDYNSGKKNNFLNQNIPSHIAKVNIQKQLNPSISFRLGENQDSDEQQLISIQLENNMGRLMKDKSNKDTNQPYEFQNEAKQILQQAFPQNKNTIRLRDQKDYVVLALNNHSRKNFEENENVTMFVGSVDNTKKVDFKAKQEKLLKKRQEQQKIRDQQFVEKQKLLELMRQNKQISKISGKRGSLDYIGEISPKKVQKVKDQERVDSKINVESSKLLYPMNITAINQIIENEQMQQKLINKSQKIDDEDSYADDQEEPKNKKNLLNKFKVDIFNKTPKIYNMNVNLRDMDERTSIEHYENIKKDIIQNQINQLITNQEQKKNKIKESQSHSPVFKGHNLQQKNTNLKFFTKRNNSGNIEASYSQTTLILSGNNTPLPYMNKKKEKFLKQINKDQDELMELLQIKKRILDFKHLQPNKLFNSFVTNMQTLDMPDEQRFKQLQDTIHKVSQQFFTQKLKPMHSTYSFDSWKSQIEKKIDMGFSCKSESNIRLPRKFGLEIGKFGLMKVRQHFSAQKFERESKSLDEIRTSKRSFTGKKVKDMDEESEKQIVYPQFDKHISSQKQSTLRMKWLMNQQINTQTKYEQNADILFSESKGLLQQELQAQEMRSKLLQKVRNHLKHKVKEKVLDKSQKKDNQNELEYKKSDQDSLMAIEEKSVYKYNMDIGFQLLKPSLAIVEKQKQLRELQSLGNSIKINLGTQNDFKLQLIEENQDNQTMLQTQNQKSLNSTIYQTNFVEKQVTQASENKVSDEQTKIVKSNIYSDEFNSLDTKTRIKKDQFKKTSGMMEIEQYYPQPDYAAQTQNQQFKIDKKPFHTINQSENTETGDHFSNPSLRFATNKTIIFNNNNKIVKLSKQLSKKDQLNQIHQIQREYQDHLNVNNQQNIVSLQDINDSEQNNLDLRQRQRLMIKKPKTAGAARIKMNRITSNSSYLKGDIHAVSNIGIQNVFEEMQERQMEEDEQEQNEEINNQNQFDSQHYIWDISREDQWNYSKSRREIQLFNKFASNTANQPINGTVILQKRLDGQEVKASTAFINHMKIQSDFNSSQQYTLNNNIHQSLPLSLSQRQLYNIKSAENTLKINKNQQSLKNTQKINQVPTKNDLDDNDVYNLSYLYDKNFQDGILKQIEKKTIQDDFYKIVIPDNLKEDYENVKIEYDKELQKIQSNFINKNIEDTFNPYNIKMANKQAEILHEYRRHLSQNHIHQTDKQQCGFFCYKQKDNYKQFKYFKDNQSKINQINVKPLLNIHQSNLQQLFQTQKSSHASEQFDQMNLFQKSSVQLFNNSFMNLNTVDNIKKGLRPITAKYSLNSKYQKSQTQDKIQQLSSSILPELKNIQTICKQSNQDHIMELKNNSNKFNQYSREMNKILDDQVELGQAVTQYIDLERAQLENQKDKQLRREQKIKQMQFLEEIVQEKEDALDDNKLLSIKEIYVDMKRNEELDHVNFLSNKVIQQCKSQKEESEKYMSKKFKKPKIWKLKYEGVIGPISYDACNFY